MQLNPLHVTVAQLLAGRLFRIPGYQRAYAWGSRQRRDLFDDIEDVQRSGREHFMATVVALMRDKRIIGADEFRTVEVVDGQQRVTTLVILLKAIEKFLDVENQTEARIKRELGELLVKGDEHSLILLQTNHDSSNVFVDYVRLGQIQVKQARTAAEVNLVEAAKECETFVSSWRKKNGLVSLVSIIRNKLSLIYHELSDESTVYRVFEVLNSRGLAVKWIDKLKSQLMALIFEHVDVGTRAEAVQEMQIVWQTIYRTLGLRGDLGDEALRFAGTWSVELQPNRIISQEDASTALIQKAGTELRQISAVGAKLLAVVEAVHLLDSNSRLRAVTRILHARFVATAIILRKFAPQTEARLLGEWERVTFRIFGLGGADTRNKVGDYVRLGYQIATREISESTILGSLRSMGEGYSIDEIICDGFWDDCYDGWTEELRYLLYRYDEYLSKQAGDKLNVSQWNKIWNDEPSRSVEHIQPQSSGAKYVHELGNLTMLPPGVNSSLRDKSPLVKAATYLGCGLRGTANVGKMIESNGKWNDKSVAARTKAIDAFVRAEWSD